MTAETASCCSPFERTCSAQHPHPRRGQPWTPAEDERLLRLYAEAIKVCPGSPSSLRKDGPAWHAAKALGRTFCAVANRYYALMAFRRQLSNG